MPDLDKASLTKVFDTSSLNLKASPGLPNFFKTSIAPSKNCGLFGLIKSLYISGSTVIRLASLSAVFTKSSGIMTGLDMLPRKKQQEQEQIQQQQEQEREQQAI